MSSYVYSSILSYLLLAVGVISDPSASPTQQPTCLDWYIDTTGSDAEFKYISECDSDMFLKITLDSLKEYDSDGNESKNKIKNFDENKYDGEWNTLEDSTYQGLDASQIEYSSTLEVGSANDKTDVPFILNTVLFSESGTISVTEFDTEEVLPSTLKWTTIVNVWPFLSSSNTLKLCITLMTNGDNIISNNSLNDQKNKLFITVDNFFIDIPLVAECGEDTRNVSSEIEENSSDLEICLIYEACEDEILTHDPFIRTSAINDLTNSPTPIPTIDPTFDPTKTPTNDPTHDPTIIPTNDPTADPTGNPTNMPTIDPTSNPTNMPTIDPTNHPTVYPTINPTANPTINPTTNQPTYPPSAQPTVQPSNSSITNYNDKFISDSEFKIATLIIIIALVLVIIFGLMAIYYYRTTTNKDLSERLPLNSCSPSEFHRNNGFSSNIM